MLLAVLLGGRVVIEGDVFLEVNGQLVPGEFAVPPEDVLHNFIAPELAMGLTCRMRSSGSRIPPGRG